MPERNPSSWRRHFRYGLLLVPAMALGAAACGAPAAREESAASAGAAFEAAVASGDHVRACGLLAPGTREQLLQDERRPCPGALAAQGLPRTHGVRTTEAYGRQALVRMAGDTLFLSLFDSGWKVVAAGCTARPGRPYDCTLKGT